MKKIFLILIGVFAVFTSCETDEQEVVLPPAFEAEWFDEANLTFVALGDVQGFEYNINENTGQSFWGVTEAEFDLTLNLGNKTNVDISKIEIYAFVEEKVGDTYNYYGGDAGKLLTTINNPDLESPSKLTVSTDDVYSLYQSELSATHNGELLPEDLVELKWVITDSAGNKLDTRSDCFGLNCTFGIRASIKYVDTWLGEFDATWIEVGSGTVRYSYTGVTVGAVRTISFTPGSEEGQFDIDDMAFGGAFGGPRGGTVEYDDATKTLTRVSVETYYQSKWEVVSVTDDILTIKWTNNFTDRFSEFGTVELSRTDGLTWPAGLTIVNN